MTTYGVVVVTYNSQHEIGRCLDSLAAAGARDVVVVDNASTDLTLEETRTRAHVRVVANPWNRGFAGAANQGIALSPHDCVLLLNPDVEIVSGVAQMARACEDAGVAAAGGRLLGSDGRPQAGFLVRRLPSPSTLVFEVLGVNRLWRRNPVNRRYRCLDFEVDQAAEVEQPPGAFIMIRRQAWRRLGGFDEIFFPVWFEDVDFCRRAVEAGYRILYVPTAVAKHAGGGSVRQLNCANRWLYWYATLLSYAAKHFRPMAVRVVSGAVILGALLRGVLGFVGFGGPGSTMAAARVIKLAGRYL